MLFHYFLFIVVMGRDPIYFKISSSYWVPRYLTWKCNFFWTLTKPPVYETWDKFSFWRVATLLVNFLVAFSPTLLPLSISNQFLFSLRLLVSGFFVGLRVLFLCHQSIYDALPVWHMGSSVNVTQMQLKLFIIYAAYTFSRNLNTKIYKS